MKKIVGIILILFVIILLSCDTDKNKEILNRSEFEFVVTGNVKNGEGKLLKLMIPSKYPNEILTSKVKNGTYLFKGKLNASERAGISVVNNTANKRLPKNLFLTKDTIYFDVEIGKKHDEFTFTSDTILKNVINIYAKKIDRKYWNINSNAWVFSDSLKNDSMHENVYPTIKLETLKFLKNDLNRKKYAPIKLYYLRMILEENTIFNTMYLNDLERKQLHNLFTKIDTSLSKTPDYEIVKSYISNLKNHSSKLTFKDFILTDRDGNKITLSDVIAKNNFTVIDFWWSGCSPCRAFNVETKPYYRKLKEKGIEIVAINVDRERANWERSSTKDQIEWINLYAGNDSNIIPTYRITSYPTKIIFDQNQKIIDFDFHTSKELFKIVE
ncbi:TlpA disulfide reductase family protein [uncultured Kordia sp.]|uniref:TlpA family protein disulfide reductase n=1 Tax=uncultured Kordia sp. TaxID=507699 RepID=UPI00261CEA9B|nr:TlpA disulfide reductase family protein [uncultured Kordia sp.]